MPPPYPDSPAARIYSTVPLTAFQGNRHHYPATPLQIPGEPFIQFGFSLSRPGPCSNERHHRRRSHFDVVSLLRYYTGESSRPPAGYLKIGLSDSDPFFDIYLEMGGAPEPRVISMPRQPGDDIRTCQKSFRHPLGGTLEEYLATSAYRTLRFNRLPNAIRLAGKDPMGPRLADVFPLLEPLGMKAFWFSNDWVQAFASRASGVIATQFPGGVLAIDLAATEPGMLEAIRQTLTQKLALPHAFTVKVAKPTHDAPLARLRERGGG
jgi:hypothetical protein